MKASVDAQKVAPAAKSFTLFMISSLSKVTLSDSASTAVFMYSEIPIEKVEESIKINSILDTSNQYEINRFTIKTPNQI